MQKSSTRLPKTRSPVFSLFLPLSYPLFILLLLLIIGNVHPNPGRVFSCLMCAENVPWRGRPLQCCICSKWVHLGCSLLSFSKFKTLSRSHSWSFSLCCVPATFGDPIPTVTSSSDSDHATIFKFKQNSSHVHVLTYIVLPSFPFFCPLLSNQFSM